MEQHVGHRTFYQNLRRCIDQEPALAPAWVEVSYQGSGGLLPRLPLPARLRGPLHGRSQIHAGLRHPADLLVFNTQVPAALAPRAARKRPYLLCTDITPRQYDSMARHYHHTPDKSGPLAAYKHRVNRHLFQHAARVLPWSTWTRAALLQDYGVALHKIELLPPGVDTTRWHPAPLLPSSPAPPPSAYPLPSAALHLLFVGGDLTRKGGHTLLQAFHALPANTAVLHLVTRTPVPAAANVRVYPHMRPNDDALLALYQACDLFVLPTEAEAFGIAAVEASAVGLPVIATPVGGLPDVVVHAETGFLVNPGDVRDLVARIQQLHADPGLRRQLGRAARARAEQRFDAHKNARRLTDILLQVAAEERRKAEDEG